MEILLKVSFVECYVDALFNSIEVLKEQMNSHTDLNWYGDTHLNRR